MENETRSPEEIERDIRNERAKLTSTLDELKHQFSLEGLLSKSAGQIREHGGDIGSSIARTAKENPMALALTGVGLAWMILGDSKQYSRDSRGRDDYYRDDDPRYRRGAVAPEYPRSPRWAAAPNRGDHFYDSGPDRHSSYNDTRDFSGYESRSHMSEASSPSSRDSLKDKAKSAKDSAIASYDSTKEELSSLSERLREGTEDLSDQARDRIIAARERAIEARDNAQRSIRKGAAQGADFYEQQPLVAGALAIAIGAALGGVLPRTQAEDDLLGDTSDSLFLEAERVYDDEMKKAGKVAEAVVQEGKKVAGELRSELDEAAPRDKSAVDAIADKAKASSARIASAGKSEANEQGLGDVRSSAGQPTDSSSTSDQEK